MALLHIAAAPHGVVVACDECGACPRCSRLAMAAWFGRVVCAACRDRLSAGYREARRAGRGR